MKISPPIQVDSLDDFEVRLTCLTVSQVETMLHFKESYFAYIKKIVQEISNLTESQFLKLTIQDAISLLVFYRMYFWDDLNIAEVTTDDETIALSPSDFIGEANTVDKDEKYSIDGTPFTPFILLDTAIKAEKLAIGTQNFKANIRRYILAGGCSKGLENGIVILSNLDANPENLGAMVAYTDAIKNISSVKVDMMSESGAIEIVATKGGELYALGFRGSRFFSFWL